MSKKIIVDAKNLVLGRMTSFVAKTALLGDTIDIVNCEESVVLGRKDAILGKYKRKMQRGIPAKGPFFYKMPDMFVKRAVRGMLPYKKERGKKALKSVKCHIGIPENLKQGKMDTIKEADIIKNPPERFINHMTVGEICKELGWKQ